MIEFLIGYIMGSALSSDSRERLPEYEVTETGLVPIQDYASPWSGTLCGSDEIMRTGSFGS
jgi:hypothetical protein